MTFIAAEPSWQCVANSSECTRAGEFKVGNKYYNARCNMSLDQWEFTKDFTSVTTDVSVRLST